MSIINEYGNVEYPPVDFDEVYNNIVLNKIYIVNHYGNPKEWEEEGFIITKKTPKNVWVLFGQLKKIKINDVIYNIWVPDFDKPKRKKLFREVKLNYKEYPCIGFKSETNLGNYYFKTVGLGKDLILLDESLIKDARAVWLE